MKRIFLLILSIILISHTLYAQNAKAQKKAGSIGFTYSSFGDNSINYSGKDLIGSASFESDHFYTIGLSYVKPIHRWLAIETGVEYSKHHILITPAVTGSVIEPSTKANFSLYNIPITLRANFFKFFFINGGLFLDIDNNSSSPISSQTGLGTLIGIGAKYDFKFGGGLFVNNYLKNHALIPFKQDDYQQRIWEIGFRIGLTYNLHQKKQNEQLTLPNTDQK